MHREKYLKIIFDPFFIIGMVMTAVILLPAVIAPLLGVPGPEDMDFRPMSPPSAEHWLGVNDVGVDIFSELAAGIGNTAFFGLIAGAATLIIGSVVGLVCAWYGRAVDLALMRLSDVLLAVPSVLILILAAVFFRFSPTAVALILAVLSWPTVAKVVRAQARVARNGEHVQVAYRMGASGFYILRRHVAPELYPLYVVVFAAKVRMAMFMEASLSFLGLFDPGRPSLGMMIRRAVEYYYIDAWLTWLVPPVACLSLLIMSVTLAALGLERTFDPRLKEVV